MGYDIVDMPASPSTYSAGRGGKPIECIVVHYTGAEGTARNNGTYFSGGDRNASAHYFLDGGDIVRSVGDDDTAWAVGNFNANQRTLSIEVCSNGEDFSDAEIDRLAWLVQAKMAEYGVDADHVIRHHDVADVYSGGSWVSPHKDCPAPYVSGDPDGSKWEALHERITTEEDDMGYETVHTNVCNGQEGERGIDQVDWIDARVHEMADDLCGERQSAVEGDTTTGDLRTRVEYIDARVRDIDTKLDTILRAVSK